MNKKPFVSVVIIFLNTEKFLTEAIESVFAQTYDQWEILLVDDGSSDRSAQIALEYSSKYSGRVQYLEHEAHRNLGMSASRNLGIAHSKGEYIALLDSDDAWFPRKLEEQASMLQSHPDAEMVFGNRMYWKSWNGENESQDSISELGFEANRVIQPPWLIRQTFVLRKAATPCPSDLMFRRDMAERVGGFEEDFRNSYSVYEDQAFLAKVFFEEPVIASSACWTKYRFRSDSCVSTIRQTTDVGDAWFFFLTWFEKYLKQKGALESDIWQTLQLRLRPYRHPILHGVSELSKRMASRILRIGR